MQINFTMTPEQTRQAWAIYLLRDHTGTGQFVGCCKFSQLFTVSDARANPLFGQIFPADKPMTVELLGIEYARTPARNMQWYFLRQNGRPYMQQAGRGYRTTGSQPIICDQTGEVFKSITEAANAHGIAQSQLSNHLMGKPGHNSVKGKTYRYQPAVPLHAQAQPVPVAVPLHAQSQGEK